MCLKDGVRSAWTVDAREMSGMRAYQPLCMCTREVTRSTIGGGGEFKVLYPEGAVLVTPPGTKSSYPRPPQSLNPSGDGRWRREQNRRTCAWEKVLKCTMVDTRGCGRRWTSLHAALFSFWFRF